MLFQIFRELSYLFYLGWFHNRVAIVRAWSRSLRAWEPGSLGAGSFFDEKTCAEICI